MVTGGGERWRDRNGERRSYGRGRKKTLPKEESAGVTEGESTGIKGVGKPGKLGEPESRGRVAAPANTLPDGPTTTRIPDSPSPLSIDLKNDKFPPARLV